MHIRSICAELHVSWYNIGDVGQHMEYVCLNNLLELMSCRTILRTAQLVQQILCRIVGQLVK